MGLPPFLSTIVDWLRAGYPDGVPEHDYVPLFALLTRRLSEDEVAAVTSALVEFGDLPISKTDIQVLITKITNEMPLGTDVERVRAHLAESGWPLADPSDSGPGPS